MSMRNKYLFDYLEKNLVIKLGLKHCHNKDATTKLQK